MAQLTAEEILDQFRERFIKEMSANAVILDLEYMNIITNGEQKSLSAKLDTTEQNKLLHAYLKSNCDKEDLMKVCDLIISMKGNPKMKRLGGDIKRMVEQGSPQASLPQAPRASLSQMVIDHPDHLMLFRQYVSRNAAGKGRAILEGVGFNAPTINACFASHPLNDEEAVQEGLIKWMGGIGSKSPTWDVLVKAMQYAQLPQQSVGGLKKELGL